MSAAGNPAMVLGGVRNDANMSSIYLNQLIHEAITEDLCTSVYPSNQSTISLRFF